MAGKVRRPETDVLPLSSVYSRHLAGGIPRNCRILPAKGKRKERGREEKGKDRPW